MFRATLAGFADPDQPELIEPYRAEYFAAVGDAWRDWSSAMAQDFVAGVYTIVRDGAETVEATDAYIAAADRPPRCAACSSRAGTTCSGRCAARSATARRL